jgi:hypothetical protein
MHSDSEPTGNEGERARLHLSGVETPIVTRITRQSARGMTVEQALPFLQLQTPVWGESQKPSRIESVSVVVLDGMPRLVLDLAFDEGLDAAPVSEPDARVPARQAHAGVVRPRVQTKPQQQRVDETVPFDSQPPARRDQTLAFKTEARKPGEKPLPAVVKDMKLSSTELELLQPKDWVFHVRAAWERGEPHLARATQTALRLSKQAARHAVPVAKRVLQACARAGAKLVALARQRMAARKAAAPTAGQGLTPTGHLEK